MNKKVKETKETKDTNIFFDNDSLEAAIKFANNHTARYGKDDVSDLRATIGALPIRHQALVDAIKRFQATQVELNANILSPDQQFKLAAIDIFVEKAQFVLTRRSNILFTLGIMSIIVVFIVLFVTYYLAREITTPPSNDLSTNALILRIFQSAAISAYIFVAVKYLISLGRSFLHEASVLRERRHSLRFGRLYAYLKKGDIKFSELLESFDWNKMAITSFLDVNPSAIAETLLHKFIESTSPAKAIEASTKVIEAPAKMMEAIANKTKTGIRKV